MKLLLLFLLLAASTLLPARAQTLTADWAVACGSAGWTASISVDAQNSTYVAGTFSGTITLGTATLSATQPATGQNAPSDVFLARLNEQGQVQWAMQFSDGQLAYPGQLLTDNAGHLFLTGNFLSYSVRLGAGGPVLYNSSNNSEGFVACFSAQTGRCQWARRFGGTGYDVGSTLALSPTGEVYLTGQTGTASADFGPTTLPGASRGQQRACLAKLDAAGTWLWARQLGSDGYVRAGQLLCDAQGALYLAGDFYSPGVTLGPATLLTHQLTGWGNAPGHDVFVAKLNAAGTVRWAVQGDATGANNAQGGSLAADGQGHLYLAGWFNSHLLHLGGLTLTNASIQGPQPNPAPPVPYTENFYADAFVARLDTAGAWQWAVRRGGNYDEYAGNVSLPATGQLLVSLVNNPGYTLATLVPATGVWGTDYAVPVSFGLRGDAFGRQYLWGTFTSATLSLGGQTVPGVGGGVATGFVARLGQLPLATRPQASASAVLVAWPSPGPGTGISVLGAPARQAVEVFDVLGRQVGGGTMPTSGPLRLSWGGFGLAPGIYIVRSGPLSTRWVVEN